MRIQSFNGCKYYVLLVISLCCVASAQAQQSSDNEALGCEQIVEEIGQLNSSYSDKKSINPAVLMFNAIVFNTRKSKFDANEARIDELIGHLDKNECALAIENSHQVENTAGAVATQRKQGSLTVPALEQLELTNFCTEPKDKIKRSYTVTIDNLEPDEYLRFFTVGGRTNSQILRASHLVYGEVRLPRMVISSRKRKKNAGLWVERMKTGERLQLSLLPPNYSCNSKGIVTVDYLNLWVSVR